MEIDVRRDQGGGGVLVVDVYSMICPLLLSTCG